MKTQKLYPAQIPAKTVEIEVTSNSPQTVIASGLGGVETINIKVWDGEAWVQASVDGVALVVSLDDNPVVVIGPGQFQLIKGITAGVASVSVCNEHLN